MVLFTVTDQIDAPAGTVEPYYYKTIFCCNTTETETTNGHWPAMLGVCVGAFFSVFCELQENVVNFSYCCWSCTGLASNSALLSLYLSILLINEVSRFILQWQFDMNVFSYHL
jgi:hypothetical protein